MSNPSNAVQERILEAAMTLFARYGFQRTSMADVAKASGVSRPTLYLRFCGKDEIFKAVGRRLVGDALARARAAWVPETSLEKNLEATILAKDLPLHRLLHSPHGEELLAIDAAQTAALAAELNAGFAAILEEHIEPAAKAGELELSAFGGIESFGRTVGVLAGGLKREAAGEPEYRGMIGRLARIIAAACRTRR